MLSSAEIDIVRTELLSSGRVVIPMADGKLFIQHSKVWSGDLSNQGMLIAFEGGGCMVYTPPKPMTVFSLVMSGFNLVMASVVYKLLCQLFYFDRPVLSNTKQKKKTKPKRKKYEPTSPTLLSKSSTSSAA